MNTMGVSREAQLRALKLLDVVLEGDDGKEIFKFAYSTMRHRWIKLKETISKSKRFSLQKLSSQYCTFFKRERDLSPGKRQLPMTWSSASFRFLLTNNFVWISSHHSLRLVEVWERRRQKLLWNPWSCWHQWSYRKSI